MEEIRNARLCEEMGILIEQTPFGYQTIEERNSTGLTNAFVCNGSVRLAGCASSLARYASL